MKGQIQNWLGSVFDGVGVKTAVYNLLD